MSGRVRVGMASGAAYDPTGLHSYIAPDAPEHVWDKVERDFSADFLR